MADITLTQIEELAEEARKDEKSRELLAFLNYAKDQIKKGHPADETLVEEFQREILGE